MQGNKTVITHLNQALSAELTAIAQYIVHAEMCDNWGYRRLGAYTRKQAIDEMKHAEGLIERILFLDGTPKIGVMLAPKIGGSVKTQIENDLAAELGAVKEYNEAAAACSEVRDNGSYDLFTSMVQDEEKHADFLESQLHMIGEIGIEYYLAQQLEAGG